MPVMIRRRNNKWCTVEPTGKTIACHETRKGAIAQLRAIEANKAMIFPGSDGMRHMLLVTSNAYRDREEEILKGQGLKEYAEGKTPTKPQDNILLFWHDGAPLGDVVYAEYYKSFLIEIARERSNKAINIGELGGEVIETEIKAAWDYFENNPGLWAASHGFRAIGKSKDGVIYPIDKYETSIVPDGFQANWYTLSEVI